MEYKLASGTHTKFAKRKILLRTTLAIFVIVAIALVIALPIIFTSRKEDQTSRSSGRKSEDAATLPTPTSAPEKEYFITLRDVHVFTSDKLEMQISINLQYYPTEQNLEELNQTYGRGYDAVLTAIVKDGVQLSFTSFTVKTALMKSRLTRSEVCRGITDNVDSKLSCSSCKNMTNCTDFNYDADAGDFLAIRFDTALRNCREACSLGRIQDYLLYTMNYRRKLAEASPVSTRVEDVFGRYPVLQYIAPLGVNIELTVTVNTGLSLASMDKLKQNIFNMTDVILDHIFTNNLTEIQRNSFETEDQQVLFAFSQLPTIFQEVEETTEDGKVLPKIIHKVEGDSWSEEAQRHNMTTTPWILHHENQNSSFTAVMIKDSVLVNVTSASESIIGLMGVFYSAFLPYPPQHNKTFQFIQSEILQDTIDEAYLPEIQRLKQILLDKSQV